jgi:hypothetical protein
MWLSSCVGPEAAARAHAIIKADVNTRVDAVPIAAHTAMKRRPPKQLLPHQRVDVIGLHQRIAAG